MNQMSNELLLHMKKKLEILEKISANTKVQIRFIQQRKGKGLLRLLREREQDLQELAVLDAQLKEKADQNVCREEIKKTILLFQEKQQEIIRDNDAAVAAANMERRRIIDDLQRVRNQRKVRNSYQDRWTSFTGSQFNQKG